MHITILWSVDLRAERITTEDGSEVRLLGRYTLDIVYCNTVAACCKTGLFCRFLEYFGPVFCGWSSLLQLLLDPNLLWLLWARNVSPNSSFFIQTQVSMFYLFAQLNHQTIFSKAQLCSTLSKKKCSQHRVLLISLHTPCRKCKMFLILGK